MTRPLLPPRALCTSHSVTLTDWTRLVDIVVNPVRGRPAHFTHDIVAFTTCGIDVDSTGSTDDHPCLSFRAIKSAVSTLNVLQFNAMKM